MRMFILLVASLALNAGQIELIDILSSPAQSQHMVELILAFGWLFAILSILVIIAWSRLSVYFDSSERAFIDIDGLLPSEIGYIHKKQLEDRHIDAAIIDLIDRGLILDKSPISGSYPVVLELASHLESNSEQLSRHDGIFIRHLFESGRTVVIEERFSLPLYHAKTELLEYYRIRHGWLIVTNQVALFFWIIFLAIIGVFLGAVYILTGGWGIPPLFSKLFWPYTLSGLFLILLTRTYNRQGGLLNREITAYKKQLQKNLLKGNWAEIYGRDYSCLIALNVLKTVAWPIDILSRQTGEHNLNSIAKLLAFRTNISQKIKKNYI